MPRARKRQQSSRARLSEKTSMFEKKGDMQSFWGRQGKKKGKWDPMGGVGDTRASETMTGQLDSALAAEKCTTEPHVSRLARRGHT